MLANFFRLPGEPKEIDQREFLMLIASPGVVQSKVYVPEALVGPEFPKHRVNDCHFVEVSFNSTSIERFEFTDCTFTSCLFIGTIFKECRFAGCRFIDCNTYRTEFVGVHIDPLSFEDCLDPGRHQNIGVHLYQELLNNSRRQSQPDFAQDALFRFRRWLRYQLIYMLRQPTVSWADFFKLVPQIVFNWMFHVFLGYGIRLRNYVTTALGITAIFAAANYCCIGQFGLSIGNTDAFERFVAALYFTVVTLTTLGYGDITPQAPLGRVVISVEAVSGFVLMALLVSMIYRKIQP